MTDVSAQLRQRNRAVWASGDWDDVSRLVAEVGPRLLDLVGIEPGMEVLDVGTGSGGSVAIPAALRGARLVGSDLVSEHFEAGRRRAAEAGVDVEWVEADAEALPFADGSFDRVLSTFGHMFAPHHDRAAAELVRVCRPGGMVGTATCRPTGFARDLFKTLDNHLPQPPTWAQPPPLWGEEDHVRAMFELRGLQLEFHHETVVFVHQGSVEDFTSFHEEKFGPVVTAKATLGDDWPAARNDLVAAIEKHDAGDGGEIRIPSDYLVTLGHNPG
ncbi:MAG TPA: class I SAM-dependent methyltransferase [Thermoleophilaceae bacterium]|nr:class I SAM-dependent methyltransferase [Thermoleophilaceae bacterium]